MTRDEFIALCKRENPTIIGQVNGEPVALTGLAYEQACEAWADMRLEQIAYEEQFAADVAAKEAARISARERLIGMGFSDGEIDVMHPNLRAASFVT